MIGAVAKCHIWSGLFAAIFRNRLTRPSFLPSTTARARDPREELELPARLITKAL